MRALLFASSLLLVVACSDSKTGGGADPIDGSGNPFQFADGVPSDGNASDGGSTDGTSGDVEGDGSPGQGGVGQPCFDDETCEDGAMCVNGWCVPDTPPEDAHSDGTPDAGGDPDGTTSGDGMTPGDADDDAWSPPPCTIDADCPEELPMCQAGLCALCFPGAKKCEAGKLMICDSPWGNQWLLLDDCSAQGLVCVGDVGCAPEGGGIGKLADTNAGLEFWAVDLRNAQVSTAAKFLDAQNAPFAVIVSNTDEVETSDVTVTYPDGNQVSQSIGPESLHVFNLPSTWGLEGSGLTQNAFRIEATKPIVAHQFNPLHNVDVFSNDASVLLPVEMMGSEYYALTLEHFSAGEYEFPGYITIVGIAGDPVEVTVTPTTATLAGPGVAAMGAGIAETFTLNQGDVIHIEAMGGDMSGTHVMAAGRVSVFAGHLAGRPEQGDCCSDHLEQQLPPVNRWGTTFHLGRSVPRGKEVDYWRVVAAKPGTAVSINGSASSGGYSLAPGEWQEFTSTGHFTLTATQPVMLARFFASTMESSMLNTLCDSDADCGPGYVCDPFACQYKPCSTDADCGDMQVCNTSVNDGSVECLEVGDPAMIIAVPVEQWQQDFVFLTPNTYKKDFINVVVPAGAQVTLDGQNLAPASFEPIGDGSYVVYRGEVSDGVHVMKSEAPAALTVYGFDGAVSYGYPGAMGLKKLAD
jgi:hypothetical protein